MPRLIDGTTDANGVYIIRPRWTHAEAVEALSTPTDWGNLGRSSQDTSSTRNTWSMSTLPEAIKWLRDGWDEQVGKVLTTPRVRQSDVRRAQQVRAFSGGAVDIGRYLQGRPDNMLNKQRMPVARPVVKIGVDLAVSGSIDVKNMLAVGRSVHTVVLSLRHRGYATEVWACWGSRGRHGKLDSIMDARVLIQAANRPVSTARLAYWCGHPSAFRRTFFALTETLSIKQRKRFGFVPSGGYGSVAPEIMQDEFSEWAPSAQRGPSEAAAWVAEVLGRRA